MARERLLVLERVLLGLLLAAVGMYAGVLLMYSVGIAPMLDALDPDAFLRFWQTHDYFVHLRIRFVYAVLGALYLCTLGTLLARQVRAHVQVRTVLLLWLAFACSAAEVAANRTVQRPANRTIRMADVGTHSAADVYGMERAVFHALHLRQAFSISAFGLLILAALLPETEPLERTVVASSAAMR